LLLVLALMSGFCCLMLPSWRHHRAARTLEVGVAQLTRLLQAAQAEAITRGQALYVCGSSDGVHCDGQWRFAQCLGVLASGVLLRVYRRLPALSIQYRGNFGRNARLVYLPSGFTQGQQGSFYLKDVVTHTCVRLLVHRSGRVVLAGACRAV
jgi:Tfp pilus assembly protein FimT